MTFDLDHTPCMLNVLPTTDFWLPCRSICAHAVLDNYTVIQNCNGCMIYPLSTPFIEYESSMCSLRYISNARIRGITKVGNTFKTGHKRRV